MKDSHDTLPAQRVVQVDNMTVHFATSSDVGA
jgi:hypothetical protein